MGEGPGKASPTSLVRLPTGTAERIHCPGVRIRIPLRGVGETVGFGCWNQSMADLGSGTSRCSEGRVAGTAS